MEHGCSINENQSLAVSNSDKQPCCNQREDDKLVIVLASTVVLENIFSESI